MIPIIHKQTVTRVLMPTIVHDESTYHRNLFEMWVASDGNTWGFDSHKQSAGNSSKPGMADGGKW
ncbi:MAG: hypothetical protein ACLFUB_19855 [Cyclobacteriaceae bacterium]